MSGFKAVVAAVAALAIHAAAGAGGEPVKADAKAFAPKDGGFSVEFPKKPTEGDKTLELPDGGEITLKYFVSEPAGKDRALMVAYVEIPDGGTEDEVLDGAVTGFAAGAGGENPTSKRMVLNGHLGREFEFAIEGKGKFRGRLYLAGGRLYQVVAAGGGEFATGDEATKFLRSFKITGPAGDHRD